MNEKDRTIVFEWLSFPQGLLINRGWCLVEKNVNIENIWEEVFDIWSPKTMYMVGGCICEGIDKLR